MRQSATLFVSVIVPVYNGQATLEKCVDSLLGLDYDKRSWELICVDNGSTDDTREILTRYGDRIRLLDETRRGPAAARNRGLAAARGPLVAFTDADCTVDPGWLRNLVGAMEGEGTVVGGRILANAPANPVEKFGERIHDHRKAIEVFAIPYVITMNLCVHLSLLKRIGLFEVGFRRGEDSDLSFRLLAAGARFAYEPQAIVHHRNESNLAGLFREGFQHGYWGVLVRREHRELFSRAEARESPWRGYRRILTSLAAAARGDDRVASLCQAVFDSGKKLGRTVGSVRFRHPVL